LAYGFGRASALKLLSQVVGSKNCDQYSVFAGFTEFLGLVFGVLWGTVSLKYGFNCSYWVATSFTIVVLGLTLCDFGSLSSPHWSYNMELQEEILKRHFTGRATNFGNAALYESLDSMEAAKELPVYVGNDPSGSNFRSGGNSFS